MLHGGENAMAVLGLDHVNVITADLDATIDFYGQLLDLKRGESPGTAMGFQGAWLIDNAGQAVIHLQAFNPERHAAGRSGATDTGWIDHVALACEGFEATKARCAELGLPFQVNDRQFGNLRQIFVLDPNNVKLELNFAGD